MTTTSITAVSVSMRSAQSTLRSPDCIQVNSTMRSSRWPKPTRTKAIHDRIADDEQEQRRDQFGRARADDAAEQARDQAAEQRKEDDRLIHALFFQRSIMR